MITITLLITLILLSIAATGVSVLVKCIDYKFTIASMLISVLAYNTLYEGLNHNLLTFGMLHNDEFWDNVRISAVAFCFILMEIAGIQKYLPHVDLVWNHKKKEETK